MVVQYPTLVCGVWIASGADEEQYKGRIASRGSVLGWCDELLGEFSRLSLCVCLGCGSDQVQMPYPVGG